MTYYEHLESQFHIEQSGMTATQLYQLSSWQEALNLQQEQEKLEKRRKEAEATTTKYWDYPYINHEATKSYYTHIEGKPSVQIDLHGLIWNSGSVIINTCQDAWLALRAGIFNDKIYVREQWGSKLIQWTMRNKWTGQGTTER